MRFDLEHNTKNLKETGRTRNQKKKTTAQLISAKTEQSLRAEESCCHLYFSENHKTVGKNLQ